MKNPDGQSASPTKIYLETVVSIQVDWNRQFGDTGVKRGA